MMDSVLQFLSVKYLLGKFRGITACAAACPIAKNAIKGRRFYDEGCGVVTLEI